MHPKVDLLIKSRQGSEKGVRILREMDIIRFTFHRDSINNMIEYSSYTRCRKNTETSNGKASRQEPHIECFWLS